MSRRLREAKVARLGPAGRAFPSLFAYSSGVNDYSFAMPRPMPPPARLGRFRWFVCILLFLATTINYADRQILSLIKPILDQRMHWSNEDFGLVNSAFQGAYAVSQLAFGWFIDAFGTKLGYAISVGAWSIAAASHGFATNLRGFFLARAGLGAAEGGNFPAAIKSISLWFPQRERAFATTLLNCGSNFGAMLAPIVVPWIALTWGWQATFIAAGGAGMLWLALWLPLYQAPEKSRFLSQGELAHIEDGAGSAPPEQKLPWSSLLRYPQTWSFIAGKFITDPTWWFFLIWLPDYFNKSRGLGILTNWPLLASIYALVSVLSVFGGWLTGRLARLGWSITRARKTVMFVSALLTLPILLAGSVGNWTVVLLLGLAGGAHQTWSANLFTSVSDMFPKNAVASVLGIGGLAGALGGVIFPLFCGKVLDFFKASNNISGGYELLFAICAFGYLAAFGLNHLFAPRFEKIRVKQGVNCRCQTGS
jgi:ACS family hexuronate transporter-like MFS transporter